MPVQLIRAADLYGGVPARLMAVDEFGRRGLIVPGQACDLLNGHAIRRSPDRPSELEPVTGFEPLTVCLQAQFQCRQM